MGIGLSAWRGFNRRRVFAVTGIVVALLVAAGVVVARNAGADETPTAVAATVGADTGTVTAEVATTGTVEPAQTRTLSFTVAGTVETVKVRAGAVVAAGDTLAGVDDAGAQDAVDNAQNTLTEAQEALTEARDAAAEQDSSTTSPACAAPAAYPGKLDRAVPVAYADPSPSITPSPSAPAGPTVTKSPAATRSPTATRSPAATKSPTAVRTPGPARTTPAGGGNQGGQGNQGVAGCPTQQSGQQSGGGQQGGAGQQGDAVLSAQQRVNQAEVALENAEDDLEGATITAPIAGRILSVAGKVGSQVGAGATFVTLADVYDMQISADFPEADAGRLAVRQQAVVTLADRAGQDFAATVAQVDPVGASDGTMVRYGVVLAFDEAPEDLLVGQTAAVRVTTGAEDGVLRVPSTAVHDIAGTRGTVVRAGVEVTVGVGLRGDAYTEITSGLAEGDQVVRSW